MPRAEAQMENQQDHMLEELQKKNSKTL